MIEYNKQLRVSQKDCRYICELYPDCILWKEDNGKFFIKVVCMRRKISKLLISLGYEFE